MKRICLISDMHCGSDVSVAFPGTITCEDPLSTLELNSVQKKFYSYWKKLESQRPYDAVFVLGDCVDGANQKEEGDGCWSTNLGMQALCAARGIMRIPIKKGGKVGFIGGSAYHGNKNPGMDRMVVKVLNSLNDRKKYNGVAEWWGLDKIVKVEELKFHLCHKISGGFYNGSALNKELIYSYIYKKDVAGIIRGHLHHYHMDEDCSRFAMLLPGWKGRDSYVRKEGLKWAHTNVGWVDLIVDGNEWDRTKHTWTVHDNIPECEI